MRKIYLLAFALIGAISNVFTAQAEDVALTLSGITDGASAWLTAPGGQNTYPYNKIVWGNTEEKAIAVAALFADNTLIGERRLVWGTGQNKKANNEIDLVNVTAMSFDYKGRSGIGGEYVAQIYDMTEDATGISVSFDAAGDLTNTSFSVWSITGGRARLVASTSSKFTASNNVIRSADTKILNGDRVVFLWTGSTGGNAVKITSFSAYYTPGTIAKENISYEVTDPTGTVQSGVYQGVTGISVPAFTGAYGMTLTDDSWEGNTYKATLNFPFPVGKPTTIMSAIGTTSYLYGKNDVVKADAKGGNEEILPTDENGADYLWNIIPVFDGTSVSFMLQNIGKSSYISSSDAALVEEASAGKFTYSETGISSGVGFMVVGSTDRFLSVGSRESNDQTVAIWTKDGNTHVGANLSFRDIQAEFDALPKSESNKFNLVAGATVISPSEYASPSDINTAIDAAAACDTDAKKVAFLLGTNGTNLIKFKNASAAHGNPVSFTYTIKGGKWGTLFSQVNFTRPAEWTLYQCARHIDGVLTLDPYTGGDTKNKPYLVKTTATEDKTYQIIGYANGAATANKKIGLLTGVIVENTKIPENSYILASKDGVQAFHKVTTNAMTAQLNKAFLTLPTSASTARSIIFIEDEATSINEIFGAEESVANNGKFVENGRVVIVKGGVKYNIAGQIVK